jgi:hypothetical protein
MTDKREEELKRIPPLRSQTHSPGELRSISMDEIDLLQVDRNGRLIGMAARSSLGRSRRTRSSRCPSLLACKDSEHPVRGKF